MNNYKVLAYITAYEDYIALESCIDAIKNQSVPVEKIFIVDNSSSKPIQIKNYDNVIIEHHPENLGVSGGLRRGLEWAFEHNYDFLWAFDQDSVPTANCLKLLLEEYKHLSQDNYKVGIIAPTPIDPRTNRVVEGAIFDRDRFIGHQHNSWVDFYECDAPITSGSVISIAAAKTISPPCADLFIDGVDLDYGLRLRRKGFHNIIVTNAIMYHNFGNPVKINFLKIEISLQKYSSLRHYYICRNHTYLDIRYAQGWYKLTSFLRRIKYLLRTMLFILLYDYECKGIKLYACLLGTCHGMQGKLGKIWY